MVATNNGSMGEQLLAEFFKSENIFYRREWPLLVTDNGKLSIWYPEFYLPDYGIVIEYFGLAGKEDYDKGIDKKKRVYFANSLTLIPVYPDTFNKIWKGYILHHIEDALKWRLEKFKGRRESKT